MLRLTLMAIVLVLLVRALLRLVLGVLDGFGSLQGQTPQRGVRMVRDPVCGTFVLPERAVTLAERGQAVHFCSASCRDKYRRRTA
jgi:YHS domain-containing protein